MGWVLCWAPWSLDHASLSVFRRLVVPFIIAGTCLEGWIGILASGRWMALCHSCFFRGNLLGFHYLYFTGEWLTEEEVVFLTSSDGESPCLVTVLWNSPDGPGRCSGSWKIRDVVISENLLGQVEKKQYTLWQFYPLLRNNCTTSLLLCSGWVANGSSRNRYEWHSCTETELLYTIWAYNIYIYICNPQSQLFLFRLLNNVRIDR
jgi:hypothetical protein